MNSLLHTENGYEDFVKTVEALLQETKEDHRFLKQELEKKQAEIKEKTELIHCLKGEKLEVPEPEKDTAENPANEVTGADKGSEIEIDACAEGSGDNPMESIAEFESRLTKRLREVNELSSHIQFYSGKLTSLEKKASKIASLGDMTVEVLKKHIEKLNEELRLREEIIAKLRLTGNGEELESKKFTNKVKKPQAGQPSE